MPVTHCIAGIIFRTESSDWLPRLREAPFEQFRVGNDLVPDVCHRIQKIGFDALTTAPPNGEVRVRDLSDVARGAPDGLESPLLRSSLVRDRVRVALDRPEQTEIWLYRDRVLVYDFGQCVLDFFYTDEYSEYDTNRHADLPPEYRVAANFRQMFSAFLPRFSAILLHGSGVIRGDKAALFLGPDESGKTTALSHSTESLILNDDQIIVRREKDTVLAHGTPLGRLTSGPCQARIGGLFVIEKAPDFQLSPIQPADLVQFLWTERRDHTLFLYPKHLKRRAFEILCDVCYEAPAYWMHFPKDHVDWDAIDAAMAK